MTFPYRVKQLRTLLTTAVGDERDFFIERMNTADAGWVIWRMSPTEFRIRKVQTGAARTMASQATGRLVVAEVHVSQVRDWQPYLPGDTIPWPDEFEPPACIDGGDKMLEALGGGSSGDKKTRAGKTANAA